MVVVTAFTTGVLTSGTRVLAQVDPSGAMSPVQPDTSMNRALPDPGNVTVNFKKADIKTVLMYLSEVSGVDIIPSPGVDAEVTMRLRNKPWEVALDIVTRNYGYVYSSDTDQGIIRVMPKSQLEDEEPITEVIPLNHIIREIELMKKAESEAIEVEKKLESIQQLMLAVNSIIDTSIGERATFVTSANSIVVTAIPARISEVKTMIKSIDKRTPQVVLDCRVIEIGLDEDQRFGIDWNAVITASGAERPITFPFNTQGVMPWLPGGMQRQFMPKNDTLNGGTGFPLMDNATVIAPLSPTINDDALFTFGTLDFSQFSATLSMIENMQDAEILSSPRITTLNNQKATIKVVEKIMLQKTQETTQTAGVVTVEFEDENEAREAGIKLVVIPHLNKEGDISVNLLPEVSNNDGFTAINVGGAQTAVALTFTSREANTVVRVKDGETIFLGGLIREDVQITENKFPILGDLFGAVPIVGNAFKYDAETVDRTEIVFFITVHIVRDGRHSVEVTETEPFYDKYVVRSAAQREQERMEARRKKEEKNSPVNLFKGLFSEEKEETDVVPAVKNTPESEEHKPFLDFRDRKD